MKTKSIGITKFRVGGMYLAAVLIVLSLAGLMIRGLNLGIDFTGGLITEFETSQSITQQNMQHLLSQQIATDFIVNASQDGTHWYVRQADTGIVAGTNNWLENLQHQFQQQPQSITLTILESDYIDTQIGKELVEQGGLGLLTAMILVMLYLALRFEWRFALSAIVALIHDVIVVVGIFSWTQMEFNLTVLASLLAIIGYSLNDSIIVADRVRELMRANINSSLTEVIDQGVRSTFTRSLITSGTTLTTVACIWWLAGAPLEGFSVALFSGIVFGTLSSICVAPTLPEFIGLKVDYYQAKAAHEAMLTRQLEN